MEMTPPLAERQTTHYQSTDYYSIDAHPQHKRLYHIDFNAKRLEQFFNEIADVNPQNLEYTPHMRFMVAKKLTSLFGASLPATLRAILLDRNSGGFTLGVNGTTVEPSDYVKFGTAVSHLIGPGNFDSMSGTYYARFLVKDTDNSDSYLRQAYRLFTLHTDGTFVDEATDWLLMMKFSERNAVGGESRILHLDDWGDLSRFADHPLGAYEFTYKSPPSKNVQQVIKRRTFFKQNEKYCVCFIDQFVQPETLAQAEYLHDLSASMEESPGTAAIPLPIGDLIMLNNLFWLHGRAPFEKNAELHRELMRQRGMFSYA